MLLRRRQGEASTKPTSNLEHKHVVARKQSRVKWTQNAFAMIYWTDRISHVAISDGVSTLAFGLVPCINDADDACIYGIVYGLK